jgi:hypothetical protein
MAGPQYGLIFEAYKNEGLRGLSVVYCKILQYLAQCPKSRSGIISFKDVFRLLSWLFHLNKRESWIVLREMQNLEALEIIPFRGVRILVDVGGDGDGR